MAIKELQDDRLRKALLRKKLKSGSWVFLAVVLAIFGFWFIYSQISISSGNIIARGGIHWHPELSIFIDGKKQAIPADIGMGAIEQPIHTHDDTGIIHLEFSGLVVKNDLKLGKFFQIWGKRFDKDCIFDKCNGPEEKIKMSVNGKENEEFENYLMRDGDRIEISYR